MKVCVVGERGIGKTTFISKFTRNSISDSLIFEKKDVFDTKIVVNGKVKEIDILVVDDGESCEKRKLMYSDVDCFLLCFSVESKSSLQKIKTIWFPEINEEENKRCILVGLKGDLIGDDEKRMESGISVENLVTNNEIVEIAQGINANGWTVISIYRHKGIRELFELVACGASIPCVFPSQKEVYRKNVLMNKYHLK